ncbi:DUF2161 domain-containing phosphodiesterase [Celeribacter marinus]|uniref:DUF2161 domain-containing phosphodiesterase n=1 Tax=Celeribacter marinus TaxID=1397108 RepID=UPI003F6B8986
MSKNSTKPKESDLYPPVKAFLEGLGYEVKAEIKDADVMGRRGDEPPVIVELKLGFSLILLHQGVARQRITDQVYLAVPRWSGRAGWKAFKANVGLAKRLGLGVISVDLGVGPTVEAVQVHADPTEFKARKVKARKDSLLKEFNAREGDPNLGGVRGARVTAYRQAAEKCRDYLRENGPSKGADVAKATGIEKATTIMRMDHYGWFVRDSSSGNRGVYGLTELGGAA